MSLLSRLYADREVAEQPYSVEVLCSNWVAQPQEQPSATGRAAVLERLCEADTVTFLARVYACQRC